jgi:hypothetical protein
MQLFGIQFLLEFKIEQTVDYGMAYQLSMDVDGLKVWAHCA